jgi:hypothetical protein
MPTSTLSNRLTSPEALVPGPVSLHSTLREPSSSQSNPNAVVDDALNLSSSSQSNPNVVECNESDGDNEIFSRVSHLNLKHGRIEYCRVLADRFKISRMQNVQNTREVAYYRLHTQTKALDPATEEGKKFARERSAELAKA